MVQLPSVSGSREGESRCPNRSLAKIHTHGGHWAELSGGVFISQVKKLLKRSEIRTRSISGDAQRHILHACPTAFIAFIEVQERSFTEGVFCLCISGVLGSTCRFQTIVTCPLLCLTVWELSKLSPWGHGNPRIQSPPPSGFRELKSNTRSPVPLTKGSPFRLPVPGCKEPPPQFRPPAAVPWPAADRKSVV